MKSDTNPITMVIGSGGKRAVTMSRDDTFNREEAASIGSRVREQETGWWRGETPLHHRGKETAEA